MRPWMNALADRQERERQARNFAFTRAQVANGAGTARARFCVRTMNMGMGGAPRSALPMAGTPHALAGATILCAMRRAAQLMLPLTMPGSAKAAAIPMICSMPQGEPC